MISPSGTGPFVTSRTASDAPGARLPEGFADKMREAREKSAGLMDQMKQLQKSMISDRKGAAQEKLNRAKEQLRILRMMGADPKQVAKQAAQIARDIKSAAMEYAGALRMEAGGGVIPQPAQTSPEALVAPETVAADTVPPEPLTREEIADYYREKAADMAQAHAVTQGERENLRNFRDAAREAKRLLEEAARMLRQKKPGDLDAQNAIKASRDMMDGISDLVNAVSEMTSMADGNAVTSFIDLAV